MPEVGAITQEAETPETEQAVETKAPVEDAQQLLVKERERADKLEASLTDLSKRYSTLEGVQSRRLDFDNVLESFRREQRRSNDRVDQVLAFVMKAAVPEEARAGVEAEIQKLSTTNKETAKLEDDLQEANELYRDLVEEAQAAGKDLTSAPEFQNVRNIWNQGWGKDNQLNGLSHLRAAIREARRVTRSLNTKVESKAEKPEIKTMPVPKASGVPRVSDEDRYKAWGQGDLEATPENLKWALSYEKKLTKGA